MQTYIALLRGINVGGHNKIKMADLKVMFEKLNLTQVTTYIQSGNIIFQGNQKNTEELSELIKNGIKKRFDFNVPVLVLTREVLKLIYDNNPFLEQLSKEELEDKKMFFTLLSSEPDSLGVEELNANTYGEEQFLITDKAVYLYAANGCRNSKLSNNFFEKKLKSTATTRNLKTIIKLLELSKLT
ncbi:DUF1697 domain-containing protein [Aquimarina sp. AU474]|uniref:DUF1697 domain-containing protein n=1 Tax=Aquimarina sp. AU474 TaxID=2108529 RepID=UPI000D69A558|nr:DUF1697 domain-containing protein [Aquimarina sp. AU474]